LAGSFIFAQSKHLRFTKQTDCFWKVTNGRCVSMWPNDNVLDLVSGHIGTRDLTFKYVTIWFGKNDTANNFDDFPPFFITLTGMDIWIYYGRAVENNWYEANPGDAVNGGTFDSWSGNIRNYPFHVISDRDGIIEINPQYSQMIRFGDLLDCKWITTKKSRKVQ